MLCRPCAITAGNRNETLTTSGDELSYEGKQVGRITSAGPGLALAYVRTEVPDDAQLKIAAEAGFARLRR